MRRTKKAIDEERAQLLKARLKPITSLGLAAVAGVTHDSLVTLLRSSEGKAKVGEIEFTIGGQRAAGNSFGIYAQLSHGRTLEILFFMRKETMPRSLAITLLNATHNTPRLKSHEVIAKIFENVNSETGAAI